MPSEFLPCQSCGEVLVAGEECHARDAKRTLTAPVAGAVAHASGFKIEGQVAFGHGSAGSGLSYPQRLGGEATYHSQGECTGASVWRPPQARQLSPLRVRFAADHLPSKTPTTGSWVRMPVGARRRSVGPHKWRDSIRRRSPTRWDRARRWTSRRLTMLLLVAVGGLLVS